MKSEYIEICKRNFPYVVRAEDAIEEILGNPIMHP